jgi:hypothetical protein
MDKNKKKNMNMDELENIAGGSGHQPDYLTLSDTHEKNMLGANGHGEEPKNYPKKNKK